MVEGRMQFSVSDKTAVDEIEVEVEVPETLSQADEEKVVAEVRHLGPRVWSLLHEVFIPALSEEADICVAEGSRMPVPASAEPQQPGAPPEPEPPKDPAEEALARQRAVLRSHFGGDLLAPGKYGTSVHDGDSKTEHVELERLIGTEVIGLFFGAQWSPESRKFEPLLKAAYNAVRGAAAHEPERGGLAGC